MQIILQDWCDFCEGKKDSDKSDFLTLFHGDIGDNYLNKALRFFPNKAQLIERIKNVRSVYLDNSEQWEINVDFFLSLALQDVSEKRKACEHLSEYELLDIVDKASPKFTSDPDIFEKARYNDWNSEFLSQVSYYFDTCWIDDLDKYYALFEAFYGLTNSYEIQWYLGKPLMKTDVNPDHYYELWKRGGNYALTETELIVAQVIPGINQK